MVETSVSMLMILHWAPTITAPVRSVTLPAIRALSVFAGTIAEERRKITSTGHFIKILPVCSHEATARFVLEHEKNILVNVLMQQGKAALECDGFKVGSFFSIRSSQHWRSASIASRVQGCSLFENRWG